VISIVLGLKVDGLGRGVQSIVDDRNALLIRFNAVHC
jgi:hypothetical protein